MTKIFAPQELRARCADIVQVAGSTAEEARRVSDNLVLANLSGHDSHGVGMLPRYVDSILEGGLQPNAHAKVNVDAASLIAMDGQRGYGQIVGEEAMVLGMQRARQTGICILTLSRAH